MRDHVEAKGILDVDILSSSWTAYDTNFKLMASQREDKEQLLVSEKFLCTCWK